MDNYPHIQASFIVEGKSFDLQSLSKMLDIFPSETKENEDWPAAIKNISNLPDELRPRCVWCVSQEEYLCQQTEVPINKIMSQLKEKESKLIDFCKRYSLKKYLTITIHARAMALPEIVLSSDIITYFGELNVEIGFDIYTY